MSGIYRHLIVVNIYEGKNHVGMINKKKYKLTYIHELGTGIDFQWVFIFIASFRDVGLEFDLVSGS